MTEPTKQPWFFRFQSDVCQDGSIVDNKIELCWQYYIVIDGETLTTNKIQIEAINLIAHPEIYAQVVALQQALVPVALAQIAAKGQPQLESSTEISDTLAAAPAEPELIFIGATEAAIAQIVAREGNQVS